MTFCSCLMADFNFLCRESRVFSICFSFPLLFRVFNTLVWSSYIARSVLVHILQIKVYPLSHRQAKVPKPTPRFSQWWNSCPPKKLNISRTEMLSAHDSVSLFIAKYVVCRDGYLVAGLLVWMVVWLHCWFVVFWVSLQSVVQLVDFVDLSIVCLILVLKL